MGNALFWSTDTNPELRRKPMEIGQYKSTMAIPADFLAPGLISINVAVIEITDRIVKHATVSDAVHQCGRRSVRTLHPLRLQRHSSWLCAAPNDWKTEVST
jgi:hypothetical protein